MSFDLGDPVPLAVTVKDPSGAVANASAITLTITLPDGTTAPGVTVTNPPAETGEYTYTYTPVQAGQHQVFWQATNPTCAHRDAFDVRSATPGYVVSLADVRKHLHYPSSITLDDDELRRCIEAATEVIESIVGPVRIRTIVERHESGQYLALRELPAVSLTTVAPWGTVGLSYNVADLRLDEAGVVERKDGGWFDGGPFEVTYKAGSAVVPAAVTEAALELVRINYRSPTTGEHLFRYERGDVEYDPEDGETREDLGFFIPSGIVALLRPSEISGFA